MSDDIVTRLRAEGEMEAVGDGTKAWWSNPVCLEAADEIERLRKIVKDLHDHLGEALYSDEWNTREYAIASYSRYEKEQF
jgi:hypothetical protein